MNVFLKATYSPWVGAKSCQEQVGVHRLAQGQIRMDGNIACNMKEYLFVPV